MDLFFGVTGSAITKSGWVEEITLALKRMFDFKGSNGFGSSWWEVVYRILSGVAINN
jgi:hypothetical protein